MPIRSPGWGRLSLVGKAGLVGEVPGLGWLRDRYSWLPADRPEESAHHPATAAMFAADLLLTAGNGEAIGIARIPIWTISKKAHQITDAAEIWAGVVDAATAGTGVEVDAPAIGSHHREVEISLGFA